MHSYRAHPDVSVFDNPATVGILDTHTGACLSSDCFCAPEAAPFTSPDQAALEAMPHQFQPA